MQIQMEHLTGNRIPSLNSRSAVELAIQRADFFSQEMQSSARLMQQNSDPQRNQVFQL